MRIAVAAPPRLRNVDAPTSLLESALLHETRPVLIDVAAARSAGRVVRIDDRIVLEMARQALATFPNAPNQN
jgi:hypothetical protein